ncbi:bifunctional phosphopantothenoylcysteine decarboxylase/phosphopantothenate--cysteine ligase CoaBC [Williamsoniiplasma lucivorax]|uniref:Coenzyme A biosynthesis bifunctional protein CoaBC n=1 Tax=Williamsoniiplasma lucivorax TaxID=209274 RepID=A0A2S5RD12_9MOLU|nr:bifunctional phosphopantothenoylcysteine decarboxylase/phosphopantothenate--cysteine ligase CoaBC [Williamsoniiplasma lucivorax]PPE05187.1 pantothenate metabolism flavoprotein [Williamsoniiplasma lucivorax]
MKKINLIITAGIAATKAKALVTLLQGTFIVNVYASEDVKHFVDFNTWELPTQIFSTKKILSAHTTGEHISANTEPNLTIVYPATYDFINKIAHGEADDLASLVLAANDSKTLWFPAMNEKMYLNPILQKSKATLLQNKQNLWLEPKYGRLASGIEGLGRAWEPNEVDTYVQSFFTQFDHLTNKKVLINLGRTRAYLDPVRYLTNGSSGIMGAELIKWAHVFTDYLEIVQGDVDVMIPNTTHQVVTNQEMLTTMKPLYQECEIAIFCAALNDYEPKQYSADKGDKQSELVVALQQSVDVAQELGELKDKQINVIFSLQDEFDLTKARRKMFNKNADLLILNLKAAMGSTKNAIQILNRKTDDVVVIDESNKSEVAQKIWATINQYLSLEQSCCTIARRKT